VGYVACGVLVPIRTQAKELDRTLASFSPKEDLVGGTEYLILVNGGTGKGGREWFDFAMRLA